MSQGVRCAARVYRPTTLESRPVVVMGHGFAGVRALRLYTYAEHFAEAGYVVVVFDYRGFGESDGSPRQVLDVRMQLQDWRAALQFARTCRAPTPAGRRLGNLLRRRPRHHPRRAGRAIRRDHRPGPARQRPRRRPSHRTAVVAPPRAVRPARPGSRAARPRPRLRRGRRTSRQHRRHDQPGRRPRPRHPDRAGGPDPGDYPQHVAARIGLKIGRYSPIKHAAGVTCPALVQIAAHDAVTPRAARGEGRRTDARRDRLRLRLWPLRSLRRAVLRDHPHRPTGLSHRARASRSEG